VALCLPTHIIQEGPGLARDRDAKYKLEPLLVCITIPFSLTSAPRSGNPFPTLLILIKLILTLVEKWEWCHGLKTCRSEFESSSTFAKSVCTIANKVKVLGPTVATREVSAKWEGRETKKALQKNHTIEGGSQMIKVHTCLCFSLLRNPVTSKMRKMRRMNSRQTSHRRKRCPGTNQESCCFYCSTDQTGFWILTKNREWPIWYTPSVFTIRRESFWKAQIMIEHWASGQLNVEVSPWSLRVIGKTMIQQLSFTTDRLILRALSAIAVLNSLFQGIRICTWQKHEPPPHKLLLKSQKAQHHH